MAGNADAGPPRRGPGFTLVELVVVLAIIGLLAGLILTGVLLGMKMKRKTEASHALGRMSLAVTSLKHECGYDTLLGVYTGGRTVQGTGDFQDPGAAGSPRDFAAGGVAAGDRLVILGGLSAGQRTIAAVTPATLTVSGSSFAVGEANLAYYIVKADGSCFPKIEIAKELNPNNPAWRSTFTPHLNSHRTLHSPCEPGSIRNGEYLDPWERPYVYQLSVETEGAASFVRERIVCSGPDGRLGTADDLSIELSRVRLGGG